MRGRGRQGERGEEVQLSLRRGQREDREERRAAQPRVHRRGGSEVQRAAAAVHCQLHDGGNPDVREPRRCRRLEGIGERERRARRQLRVMLEPDAQRRGIGMHPAHPRATGDQSRLALLSTASVQPAEYSVARACSAAVTESLSEIRRDGEPADRLVRAEQPRGIRLPRGGGQERPALRDGTQAEGDVGGCRPVPGQARRTAARRAGTGSPGTDGTATPAPVHTAGPGSSCFTRESSGSGTGGQRGDGDLLQAVPRARRSSCT